MNRFKYAFQGMVVLLNKDKKFLLHLIIGLIVIVCGMVFNITKIEWLFILLAIGLVLAFEAINTAVEFVVDLVTTDFHILAKKAKDIAAFSVVISSIIAVLIGLMIFLPYVF
ncbi:diacylglycerol kinase family protein [Staphylococcus edaphicus]|uniref:Diacylglycerol kinase n=1 Tax=Staphylococcus edaphicus TaxID=1955013 RepID=A0A2C6WPR6_9STAP|nr:diacylglycerol kinase family protein [Staphylococcus edaphicus]PHK49736.1 diacylglycerol kinase [Staphylococcus edaphicus]UQW80304.1 diacylglycerol kinase family protein [Staphylococcus edaphicus]